MEINYLYKCLIGGLKYQTFAMKNATKIIFGINKYNRKQYII